MLRDALPAVDAVIEKLELPRNFAEIPAGVFGRVRFTVPE